LVFGVEPHRRAPRRVFCLGALLLPYLFLGRRLRRRKELFGGAQRVIARALRRRAMGMRPASASGFWANMRESFARGRAGLPWQD